MTKGAWLVAFVAAACGRIRFSPLRGDAPGADATDATVVADAGSFSSCVGLSPICGPAGASSCCDSKPVTGGTFYRGFDLGSDNMYTDISNPATVSDFYLDAYEVTVGRFRQFVTAGFGTQAMPPPAGAGEHPNIPNSGWDPSWNAMLPADTATLIASFNCSPGNYWPWTDQPGAIESLPMTCVDWLHAMAFCAWDGGYLPTEAELNYAAAGGSLQRAYPWSNPASDLTIDCTDANYLPCLPSPGAPNRVGSESPMGDGYWGQSDLAGNAWEWVLDEYSATYVNPCNDCAPIVGTDKIFRGGIFNYYSGWLRAGYRGLHGGVLTTSDFNIGFRCARSHL